MASSILVKKLVSFLGSGLKGDDDLCFHISRNFSFFSYILFPTSRLISQPRGLETQISVLRLKSLPQGPNQSLEAKIPSLRSPDWDLVLKAKIWASRLRYGPGGWREGGMEEEKEKEEKFLHM